MILINVHHSEIEHFTLRCKLNSQVTTHSRNTTNKTKTKKQGTKSEEEFICSTKSKLARIERKLIKKVEHDDINI